MAATVGAIVTRIQDWIIDSDIEDVEVWALMDEVIDEVLTTTDPWYCNNYATTARTAANHMNDSDLIPPAYVDGVLAVDANIANGSEVPDNSEYLRALEYPTGLVRPGMVYYGALADEVQLQWIGLEEMNYRYPFTVDDSGGEPAYWTSYNDTLIVGPTPSLACTLAVFGVYRPVAISANGDSNVFSTYDDRLLRYGVMNKLILYNYEEDGGRGPNIERTYNRLVRQLRSASKHRDKMAHRVTSRRAGTRRT